jgi:hypothetical protein
LPQADGEQPDRAQASLATINIFTAVSDEYNTLNKKEDPLPPFPSSGPRVDLEKKFR